MSFARAKSNQTCIVDLTRTSLTRGCLCWRDLSRLSIELIAAPTVREIPATCRQERCTKNIPRLTACDIWLGVDRQLTHHCAGPYTDERSAMCRPCAGRRSSLRPTSP